MPSFRFRLTYANVMSTAALFLAMGGTSYAATKLAKNSVNSAAIQTGAVSGSKIKDGTITPIDLQKGLLNAGPKGPQGEPGPEGPAGATGARGEAGVAGAVEAYENRSDIDLPLEDISTPLDAVTPLAFISGLDAGVYVVTAKAVLTATADHDGACAVTGSDDSDDVESIPLGTSADKLPWVNVALAVVVRLNAGDTISFSCTGEGATGHAAHLVATRATKTKVTLTSN